MLKIELSNGKVYEISGTININEIVEIQQPELAKGIGKVFLQGVMQDDGTMSNELQEKGLLPKQNPYGLHEICEHINDVQRVGKIVDWVLVEIWGNFAQTSGAGNEDFTDYDLLQSKALLLRTDGTMIDVNGKNPVFSKQDGNVRVAVFHRNHLNVLSKLQNASNLDFDFSDLEKVEIDKYCEFLPLINKYGKNCLYAGDLNQDSMVEPSDVAIFENRKIKAIPNTYNVADMNMDGLVDEIDGTLIRNNFKMNVSSPCGLYNKR